MLLANVNGEIYIHFIPNVLNSLSGYCLYPDWVPDDGGGIGMALGNHREAGQPCSAGSSRLNQCIFPFSGDEASQMHNLPFTQDFSLN